MSMDSDEALYARVKRQGDMHAFDELYERYCRRLYGFLKGQLRTRADAEDVFHEALMATESDEVVFDRGSFRTWLYRIARNLVLNRIRSEGRGENALGKLACDDEPVPSTDERVADMQLLRALDGAVARLPSPLSEVYHLRSSGLSYEEMATVLGIPLGTLKSRMSHMVNVLREELKPWTAR
jgi:RNA polymerase sigma-70 factor (ECF subfamily)